MLSSINPFKKAASRITACCLFVIMALFSFVSVADAATVTKKTSSLIGDPQVANNKVTFTLGGTVKYVQHAKYVSSDYKSPVDIGITRTRGGRITGFAYACPGYYTTRIYSDSNGQTLLGYIQVYVSAKDINNSKCDSISPPPGGADATPPTPPAPKAKHPVPEVEEVKKVSTPHPTIKPKKPEAVTKPPTQTFDQLCVSMGRSEDFRYQKVPGANPGDDCCPVERLNEWAVGTTFKVLYMQPGLDYETYYSPPGEGWGCGNYYGPISDTYCPADLNYNSSTNTCNEEKTEVKGYLGDWSANEADYYVESADYSDFGEFSDSPPPDPENPDPIDPENPDPPAEQSCEENPDQDHCPPPCYCEKMGDWGYLCCVFDCPGMDEFKNFLAFDLVGSAHAPPVPDLPAPNIPNIFDILNDVDQRNPPKPTGQEDPNLGDASFDANEIKDNAPEIQFREDPTGGFNIVNPLDTLPEDGSEAPRPQEELETLPYPGGSGEHIQGGDVPKPENSGQSNEKVDYPGAPEGSAKPPNVEGSATPPTIGGTINYPGT